MPTIPLYPPNPERQSVCPGTSNPLPELLKTPSGLAILEIQGTINMPHIDASSAAEPALAGSRTIETSLGRLVFPDYVPGDGVDDLAWTKRVYLYVGRHQRLTGEVKKLRLPMAVVRRKADKSEDHSMEGNFGKQDDINTMDEELEILEVVKWKIIFSQRPEPVGD